MTQSKIAFIGGGNMARSLIGGLVADGYPADRLSVADPSPQARELLATRFGIQAEDDGKGVVRDADVVVLAVKPQILRDVAGMLADSLAAHRPLMVSIAAGIRAPDIDRWLGGGFAVVRTMPNTPALVQSGATVLYANERVSDEQRSTAESILRAVGLTQWVDDEALMDAVTALSGSGPAYFFLVMEALEEAGVKLGLDPATARLLCLQTAFGAAKMALESDEAPAELRRRVTSPGGTTEAALRSLEAAGLVDIFARALQAARDRSQELADELGRQ